MKPNNDRPLSLLEQEQLEHLVRTTPVAWALSTMGALVCYLQFRSEPGSGALDLWFFTFCTVSAARLAAALWWRSAGRAQPPSAAHARAWLASTVIHAVQWGWLPLVLMQPGSAQAESILHITLVAVAMGGAVRLPGFPRVLIAHVVLVLGPLLLRDLVLADGYLALMVVMVFLIGVYTLVSGRNQARSLREIEAQRRRNGELIAALQRENARSEAALRVVEQASAARTRFFAAANHDLRQPLHALSLLSQTLLERRPGQDIEPIARHIGSCVDGMTQVIDDLLEITRLDIGGSRPQWSVFALDELVEACCRPHSPLARAKGLALHIQVPGTAVQSDRSLVARVIGNLISNAIRYTPSGAVTVRAEVHEDGVRLAVEDTGVGIAAAHLPRIFDEFFQVGNAERDRRQGLGLGLSTVKRLSDLLGLRVTVRSTPGQGSCFTITLPLAPATMVPGTAPGSSPIAEVPIPRRRVLVVEDDADARTALAGLLRSWDCETETAADTDGGLRCVNEGFRPDVLVVDLRLPGGASGIDAVRQLRSAVGEALPALIVTGDAGSEHIDRAREAGLPTLVKPVRPLRLRAFLTQAFAQTADAPAPP